MMERKGPFGGWEAMSLRFAAAVGMTREVRLRCGWGQGAWPREAFWDWRLADRRVTFVADSGLWPAVSLRGGLLDFRGLTLWRGLSWGLAVLALGTPVLRSGGDELGAEFFLAASTAAMMLAGWGPA